MAQDDAAKPVGSGAYVVGVGECLNGIARSRGFHWTTLWDHPQNRALRDARKDHNILLPGDRLYIPELGRKQESCPTTQRHRFRMKGRTSLLKLRLLDYDDPEPYANRPYRLEVEGELYEGTIDAEGCLEARIDPRAKRATLHVGQEQLDLTLGGLDPIDSVSGAQQRLTALGYYANQGSHAEWDAASLDALKRFQSACLITPSGKYDATTRTKLEETYGC